MDRAKIAGEALTATMSPLLYLQLCDRYNHLPAVLEDYTKCQIGVIIYPIFYQIILLNPFHIHVLYDHAAIRLK